VSSAPGRAVPALALVLAAVAAAAAGGFWLGRASARSAEPEGTTSLDPAAGAARPSSPAVEIGRELVEISLPRIETDGLVVWAGVAAAIEQSFARHGLALDLADESGALALLKKAGAPEEVAALLDARAAVDHAADGRTQRDALTRLARALDPDPTRDSIRAPLLANDADAVRAVAADLDASKLPLRTATLLGAALLRGGDEDDAFDVWRTASIEHPDDPALHVLLGWRLAASDPPRLDEARRHRIAARALLPESPAVKARLEVMGR